MIQKSANLWLGPGGVAPRTHWILENSDLEGDDNGRQKSPVIHFTRSGMSNPKRVGRSGRLRSVLTPMERNSRQIDSRAPGCDGGNGCCEPQSGTLRIPTASTSSVPTTVIGYAAHFCFGAPSERAEGQIAFEVMRRR